jgi:hypothetical protein
VGQRQFRIFCIEHGLINIEGRHLPSSPQSIIYFVADLATKGLAYKSIKLYLTAIKYEMAGMLLPDIISDNFHLQQVLRGIKKSNSNARLLRLPITINILCAMEAHLHSIPNTLDRVMLRAAMRLAYYGFLRVSEFCSPSPSRFDHACHLGAPDITFFFNGGSLSHMSVHIKQSKTDPFRVGQTIHIGATNDDRCPVLAIREYMSLSHPGGDVSRSTPSPLFIFRSGEYLTRATLVSHVHGLLNLGGIPSARYNSHSFRSGAVTTCSNMVGQVSDTTIRALGRWKSDAHRIYDRSAQQTCIEVTRRMSCMLPQELRFGGQ